MDDADNKIHTDAVAAKGVDAVAARVVDAVAAKGVDAVAAKGVDAVAARVGDAPPARVGDAASVMVGNDVPAMGGNAAAAIMDDASSALIADAALPERYQIKGVIGQGGMGVVFEAFDLGLSRAVAIKILAVAAAQDEKLQERFLREARALASLDHPNIVKLFTSGLNTRAAPFHVMEYLEGISLREELDKSGNLAPARFFEIFAQILCGLSHAHENELVHRDLKPSNIMLCKSDDGQKIAKIIDFGIARQLAAAAEVNALTATNSFLGSPAYMSPEQCQGKTIDKQSDIYSLGCIMYECLSGTAPFHGDLAFEVMYKHMSQRAPELTSIEGTELWHELALLVDRCLEKEPGKRPESAAEIGCSLSQIFARDTGRLAGSFSKSGKSSLPAKILFPLLAIVIVAIGILIAFCLRLSAHKESNLSALVMPVHSRQQKAEVLERLKRSVGRAKSFFDSQGAKESTPSEETKNLLMLLQHLAREQLQSSSIKDRNEAKQAAASEIAVAKSVADSNRQAAGYLLRGQAEALLGEFNDAKRDFNQCQAIILRTCTTTSSKWNDFLLYRAMFYMRQMRLRDAENDLKAVFSFWYTHEALNPKHALFYREQLLDQEGPDRYRLVVNCLKTVEEIDLRKPADVVLALSVLNRLTIQLYDFDERPAGRESIAFSRKLLSRIPAGNDAAKAATQELMRFQEREKGKPDPGIVKP